MSYILTGDRDSLQLITDTTNVILMRNHEDELFDNGHFFDTYGITPSRFVDVKALMGDSSDCIPGVAGIGEKTALKLISAAGSLDGLYAAAEDGYFGATPSVKRKLDDGKASAYMSLELARICTEAPVGKNTDEYVKKAVAIAGDRDLLNALHLGIRNMMLSSKIMDVTGYMKEYEDSFLNLLDNM